MSNQNKLNPDVVAPHEWPELIPLAPEVEQGKPYPIDALPDVMANAAREIAEQVKAPVAMAAQCVIGAVTHLAQPRVSALHPKDIYKKPTPCSLFILTLGDSGDGKSRCRDLAFREADALEKKNITESKRKREDLLEQAKGATGSEAKRLREEALEIENNKTLFDEATIEGLTGRFIRGMASASWDTDEGAQFFGGHTLQSDTKAAALGVMTKIFDDGKVSRERSRSNEGGSGDGFDKRFTIHLLAQEYVVRSALADPLLREQGLLPRFLFAAPASLAGTRFNDIELIIKQRNSSGMYYPHLETYWGRYRKLLATPEVVESGEVHAPAMPLTDDAVRVLLSFDDRIEEELAPLGDFFNVKAFARRALEQASRLACVFAYFEEKTEVTAEMAEKSTQLAQHSLDEWVRHSGASVISPVAQKAMHFIEWAYIPERADKWREFTGREFSQFAPKSLRPAKTRNEVLAALVEHNYLLTDGKAFRVNPHFTPATTATTATQSLQPNSHAGYGVSESCYTSATPCYTPATKAESSSDVAACSKDVANRATPQSQQPHGLQENVADVADVAAPKRENAPATPEKQTNTGWEVL